MTNSGDATVQRFSQETFTQGPIRTFNVGRRPIGITYADSSIWVANSGDATVTRIDPASGAIADDRRRRRADGARERGGRGLGREHGRGTVSRIDPATNDVVATIEIGSAPSGIAAGGRPSLGLGPVPVAAR